VQNDFIAKDIISGEFTGKQANTNIQTEHSDVTVALRRHWVESRLGSKLPRLFRLLSDSFSVFSQMNMDILE
jgi:hypothetical protein